MLKRTFQYLLLGCVMTGTLGAADVPFIGKWKLNPSKSELTDEMKIEPAGENKYTLTFAGDAGETETIVADGTDQPGVFGTTFSITIEGPDTWTAVRKKDGRTLLKAVWKLGNAGKTLTDAFTGFQGDGSTIHFDTTYKRATPGTGIPGTWESTSEKVDSFEMEIQPYQEDGLSFINAAQRQTRSMKFDGKDYPEAGPNMSSGHRVNERTLERTDKVKGKVVDTREIKVSADLKTLTMTVNAVGQSRPNILVFDRE